MTYNTTDLITRSDAALAGTTAGPWTAERYTHVIGIEGRRYYEDGTSVSVDVLDVRTESFSTLRHGDYEAATYISDEDLRFIAEARELMPALLAEVKRTRALVEAAEAYQTVDGQMPADGNRDALDHSTHTTAQNQLLDAAVKLAEKE